MPTVRLKEIGIENMLADSVTVTTGVGKEIIQSTVP